MNIGIIVVPNQKGQIVIPKKARQALNINPGTPLNLIVRGGEIYIHPVEEVIVKTEKESTYSEILEMTRGAWLDEDWDALRKRRRKIELAASRKRKKAW